MIAAIYARKSTDQAGVSDEAKSVTRQIAQAKAYGAAKGWTVSDDHIYTDDGISGAEFAGRPGFVRLMNALKPEPAFDVLIMSEESRLGREAIETAYALKQLITSGVRVFFYLEDRERTFDSPTDKLLLSVTAFADELEREKARQRTYDAMQRKARAGHVTGGRVFGYSNATVAAADGSRSHVERRTDEAEAAIVRRIFRMCAAGYGQTRIAKTLNAEGVLAPRSQQGRPRAWAPSTVREVLRRPLYRGDVVWNRTKKRDTWGRKHRKARASGEWISTHVEALRIVDEKLWHEAHGRLKEAREVYLRGTNGQLWGRPARGAESKYLLPGLARCAQCGGSIYVKTRDHGRRRAAFYGCTSYHLRGRSVCSNGIEVPMETANRIILDNFADLLQPAVIDAAIERTLRRTALAPQEAARRRQTIEARLAAVEAEIARYTAAIGAGGELSSLVSALQEREAQRTELQTELRRLSGVRAPSPAEARRELEARLEEWRDLLTRRAPQGRQMLKKLLSSPIRFTPVREGIRCGWQFSGTATLSKLLAGTIFANMVTSPAGFADGQCLRHEVDGLAADLMAA